MGVVAAPPRRARGGGGPFGAGPAVLRPYGGALEVRRYRACPGRQVSVHPAAPHGDGTRPDRRERGGRNHVGSLARPPTLRPSLPSEPEVLHALAPRRHVTSLSAGRFGRAAVPGRSVPRRAAVGGHDHHRVPRAAAHHRPRSRTPAGRLPGGTHHGGDGGVRPHRPRRLGGTDPEVPRHPRRRARCPDRRLLPRHLRHQHQPRLGSLPWLRLRRHRQGKHRARLPPRRGAAG